MRAIFSTKQAKLVAYALNQLAISPKEASETMKRVASDLAQYINKTEWEAENSIEGLPTPEDIEAHDFEKEWLFFVTPNHEMLGLWYNGEFDDPIYQVYDVSEQPEDERDLFAELECFTYRELEVWYKATYIDKPITL